MGKGHLWARYLQQAVSGFGLVAGLRRGGEGLGRSSAADGVSVVKTADTKRTRVDWECCEFVALMLLLTAHIQNIIPGYRW